MEKYQRAYDQYIEKCEMFGINLIDMIEFIQNVTEEQAEKMLNELTN